MLLFGPVPPPAAVKRACVTWRNVVWDMLQSRIRGCWATLHTLRRAVAVTNGKERSKLQGVPWHCALRDAVAWFAGAAALALMCKRCL